MFNVYNENSRAMSLTCFVAENCSLLLFRLLLYLQSGFLSVT